MSKQFRIYYHDGTTYDGDPFQAPAWGVLVIVEPNRDSGRQIVQNGDYYCWSDNHWYPMDYIGMVDYLARPGPRKVIFGRLVSYDDFYSAYIRADNDPDFPKRTNDGRLGSKIR